MTARETFEREMRPFEALKDNYQKFILTADKLTPGNYNGIIVENIMNWLTE